MRTDPDSRMHGSRICEYEKWPMGGVRPSVRTLKILAAVYETSWDRLVDVEDLEAMPARDRQAFLDISDFRYGDSWDLPVPRQRGGRPSAPRGDDDTWVNRTVTIVRLAAGDVLYCDNKLILHGRTAFQDPRRLLYRTRLW